MSKNYKGEEGKFYYTSHAYNKERRVIVGVLRPDKTFFRHCAPDHVLHTPPALAVDAEVFREALEDGAERFLVKVEGKGEFKASAQQFQNHYIPINRGAGRQVALPLSYWERPEQGRL